MRERFFVLSLSLSHFFAETSFFKCECPTLPLLQRPLLPQPPQQPPSSTSSPPGEELAASTRAKFLSFLQTYTLEEEALGGAGGNGADGNATAVSDASVQRSRRGGSARTGTRSQTQIDETGPATEQQQQAPPRQAPQQPYYVSVLAAMAARRARRCPSSGRTSRAPTRAWPTSSPTTTSGWTAPSGPRSRTLWRRTRPSTR